MRRLLPLLGLAASVALAQSPAFSQPVPGETGVDCPHLTADCFQLSGRDPGETGRGGLHLIAQPPNPGEAGDLLTAARPGETGPERPTAAYPGETGPTPYRLLAEQTG